MIRNYRLPTLVLIFPVFVIMEIGLILFSLKSGWFKEKIRVWLYFLSPEKWFYLIKARYEVKKIRKVKDSDIIDLFSGEIAHQGVDDIKLKLINPFFNLYWQAVLEKRQITRTEGTAQEENGKRQPNVRLGSCGSCWDDPNIEDQRRKYHIPEGKGSLVVDGKEAIQPFRQNPPLQALDSSNYGKRSLCLYKVWSVKVRATCPSLGFIGFNNSNSPEGE
jgi:hypothetical protein